MIRYNKLFAIKSDRVKSSVIERRVRRIRVVETENQIFESWISIIYFSIKLCNVS